MLNIKKIILIVICVIIAVPVFAYARFSYNCKQGQNKAQGAVQDKIDSFNQTKMFSSLEDKPANVYKGGDCLDSQPYVQVDKSYDLNLTGNTALNDLRSSLTQQGYQLADEKFSKSDCGITYGVNVNNNSIKFSAHLLSYSRGESRSCYSDGSVTEQEFNRATIKYAWARLDTPD
jgi:hypothetical protein